MDLNHRQQLKKFKHDTFRFPSTNEIKNKLCNIENEDEWRMSWNINVMWDECINRK